MKIKSLFTIIAALALTANFAMAQGAISQNSSNMTKVTEQNEPIIDISTTMGDIKIKLYNDTPLHRDNFLKLVEENYYDSVLFHRVIKDFMIQTGDPDSKNASPEAMLGAGGPAERIPAEIVYPKHFHKRGALAAARDNNPAKSSSASQFYIVTGRVFPADQIAERVLNACRQSRWNELLMEYRDNIEQLYKAGDRTALDNFGEELKRKVMTEIPEAPAEIVEAYSTIGGAPHLDGEYTVFGEVIEGMDVVDKIQNVETRSSDDRPVEDVRILSVKLEK